MEENVHIKDRNVDTERYSEHKDKNKVHQLKCGETIEQTTLTVQKYTKTRIENYFALRANLEMIEKTNYTNQPIQ